MTPSEVLTKAADLIEEKGWWNGDHSQWGDHCALTALGSVGPATVAVQNEAVKALAEHLGYSDRLCPPAAVMSWNDAFGRTQEEVVTAMREAAKTAVG